jgi:hypothetical protein
MKLFKNIILWLDNGMMPWWVDEALKGGAMLGLFA